MKRKETRGRKGREAYPRRIFADEIIRPAPNSAGSVLLNMYRECSEKSKRRSCCSKKTQQAAACCGPISRWFGHEQRTIRSANDDGQLKCLLVIDGKEYRSISCVNVNSRHRNQKC